jgi:hypothetical protein
VEVGNTVVDLVAILVCVAVAGGVLVVSSVGVIGINVASWVGVWVFMKLHPTRIRSMLKERTSLCCINLMYIIWQFCRYETGCSIQM